MKKIIRIGFIAALSFTLLLGCRSNVDKETELISSTAESTTTESITTESITAESTDPTDKTAAKVKVAALKGPTAMGMLAMIEADKILAEPQYDFTIMTAIDEITADIAKGEVDIATVPANLASILFNNTNGQVQVLAINTLGVLTIVENGETISTIEDLRGKTIYATGKGATPEYALNFILESNGLVVGKDVEVEFKSEPAECVAILMQDKPAVAMLPQPFATTAMMKNEQIRMALDLTAQWDNISTDSTLITGVVIARTEFIESAADQVAAFLKDYEMSVAFVNDHIEEAAVLIEANDIVPAAVAEKAIPYCNITFIAGAELKSKLNAYLAILQEQNPDSIGGELPDDTFYYSR